MFRKLFMTGLLMAFLTASTSVFAEGVFITQKGTKYHKDICRLVKNKDNVAEINKKQAIEEDYGPCKRCFKEDIVSEENK